MSYRLFLIRCFILTTILATLAVAQEKVAPFNRFVAKRWYEQQHLTPPQWTAPASPAVRPLNVTAPDMPDVQVYPSTLHETENSIAVSQANPQNLMISVNELNSQPAWFSTNGGTTWFGNENDPGGTSNFGDPVALFDLAGAAYWGTLADPGGIKVARTTNFGTTWTVASADPLNSTNDDKEHIMTDLSGVYPANMYAAWTDFGISGNPIVLTRSTDHGATWGARVTIYSGSDGGQGTNIATGPNGEVYCTFANYAGGNLPEAGIRQSKSTDGGATWSAANIIFPISGIRTTSGGIAAFGNTRVNSFPSTGVDRSNGPRRGWVYVTYADQNTGDADVYVRRSSDGGTTWSSAIRVNGETAGNGQQQWFPSVAVDPTDGSVNIGYYSQDTTGILTARYVARSLDGGNTWDRTRVSDVRFTPSSLPSPYASGYCGDYYETAAYSGNVWACWSDNRTGVFNAYVSKIASANYGYVRGTVTSNSVAVPGVAIDFTDSRPQVPSTTASNGTFKAGILVDTSVTSQVFTIRAQKFGYVTKTDTVRVVRNDTVTKNLTLTAAAGGTLAIHAYRSPSIGMHAAVTVNFNGTPVVTDFTDSTTGNFSTPLPIGTYQVIVDPPAPYGTRTFNGVVISASTTTNIDALVRSVIEYSPAAVRDTLPVNGTHVKTLVLTNTTAADSIPYRISDDNARITRPVVLPPKVIVQAIQRPKGVPDTDHGMRPNGHGGPDAYGYSWIDSDDPGGPAFNWVDISSTGTQISTWTGTADDGYATVTLPWAFTLYGNSSNSLNIVTNGWVNFGTASHEYSNDNIPTAASPNNAIYPFWDDLNVTGAGRVFYKNDSTNGRFIVQYDKVPRYGSTTDSLTFEVILKPNGEILFQYLRMVSSTLNSATIGIENAAGSVATNIVYNNTYVHDALATRVYLPDAPWLSENPTFGVLPPNSNVNIQVTFDASNLTPGTLYNGKIVLDGTHPKLTARMNVPASLQVNAATNALMVLNKAAIAFPGTVIGNVRRDTINARNAGGQVLNVTSITTTNTRFTVSQSSATINPGSNVNIIVTYTPVVPAGADTGRVIFLSNSSDATRKDVTLSGTSVGAPIFAARVDSLTKTVVARNLDSTRFYVRNTGTLAGNYATRAVMNGVTGPWLSVKPLSGTIAIGDSAQLTAMFDARDISIVTNPGTYYGRIEVSPTNSAIADTLRIPVRLTVTPITGAALYVNPDSAVFTNVPIGQTDSSKTFLAKNIGTSTLTVTNIVSSNPVFGVSRTSFTLNTNDTTRVRVRFTGPTPAGLRTGTLTFTSNDPNAPTVRLSGTSIGQASIVVAPDSFSFSLQQGTDTTRANLKIKNPGSDTLRFTMTETLRPGENNSKSIERSMTQQAVSNMPKGAIDPSPAQRPDSSGGPDAFGYRWIDSDSPGGPTYSWTDITTVGTQVTTWTNGTADDGSVVVALPFNFRFYGTTYAQLKICTNGWQGFDVVSTNTAYSNTAIPATAEPNAALYPFWDDMDLSSSGTVHYYSDAANNRFVVQYTNVPHYGTTEPGLYTFQTILYADGRIVYQYKDMQQTLNSSTIGVENSDGTVALQVLYDAAYVHNNLAIQISTDLVPWLSLNRTNGTVAPGDSTTVQVQVVPNTTAGTYIGHELITGNTPSTARVAVRMQVMGGPPAITVTSPHGGEIWRQGSTYAITWNQTSVDTVKIEYSTAGNAGPWNLITAGVPARMAQQIHPKAARLGLGGGSKDSPLGTFNWTIPLTVSNSTNCFVKVSWKDTPATFGVSAAAFAISNVTPPDTSWLAQSLGSTTPTVYCIRAVSKNVVWVGTTGGGVYLTTNGGTTWTSVTGTPIGTDDVNDLDALDANTAFVSTSPTSGGTKIIRTTNAGASWAQVYSNTSGFIDGIRMVSSTTGYAVGDPVSSTWAFLKTTDGGATWSQMATAPAQSGTEAGWNGSFQITGSTMWFGTNSSHIYKSTNAGATWTAYTTTAVNSYGLHFNSANVGMSGFESGICDKSTDAGSSWQAAAILPNAGQATGVGGVTASEFWVTGGNNIYWTTNQGTSWSASPVNGYTGAAALWAIDMVASGSDVYGWAGGASGTILRYRRQTTDVTSGGSVAPTVYALDQNFPNPFNPTTTIRFSLPEQSTVSLKIYNLLGQEVATLVQGNKPASFYTVVWNGTNSHGAQVASGLYFYRLDATGVSGTQFNSLKKLIFLK